MKRRLGFVSNSSSSSFLIVGTADTDFIRELADKEQMVFWGDNDRDFTYLDYGVKEGKVVSFFGSDEPYHVGMSIEVGLEEGKTLDQLKEEFQKRVREAFDIEIPLPLIKLYFGECGDG